MGLSGLLKGKVVVMVWFLWRPHSFSLSIFLYIFFISADDLLKAGVYIAFFTYL